MEMTYGRDINNVLVWFAKPSLQSFHERMIDAENSRTGFTSSHPEKNPVLYKWNK